MGDYSIKDIVTKLPENYSGYKWISGETFEIKANRVPSSIGTVLFIRYPKIGSCITIKEEKGILGKKYKLFSQGASIHSSEKEVDLKSLGNTFQNVLDFIYNTPMEHLSNAMPDQIAVAKAQMEQHYKDNEAEEDSHYGYSHGNSPSQGITSNNYIGHLDDGLGSPPLSSNKEGYLQMTVGNRDIRTWVPPGVSAYAAMKVADMLHVKHTYEEGAEPISLVFFLEEVGKFYPDEVEAFKVVQRFVNEAEAGAR